MANHSFRRPQADPADQYDDQRAHDPRSPQQESDPLAELARLIGQTDPLSSFGREPPQGAPREPQFAHDHHETPAEQDQDYADDAAQQPPSWLQGSPAWRNQPQAEPEHSYQDPHTLAQDDSYYAPEQPAFAPSHSPSHALARGAVHGATQHGAQDDRYEAYPQGADPRYDDALYGRAPQHAHHAQTQQDDGPPYAYPGHEQGYDDQYADAEEPPRRRGGLLTVGIVAALAVVGTAGAFAYRSYSGAAKSGEPPVIKADASPTKVVPPAPTKDPSGKVITDRIGQGAPGTERVVSREEAPVDVKGAGPRVVFPPLTQQPVPPATTAATSQPMQGGGGMSDEPKKIRTERVRPDGTAVAPAKAAPAPVRTASSPTSAATNNSNAPMALTPQSGAPAQRTAALAPESVAPAPAATGGYVVQVSSQKSEADASSSFRALQAKFPAVLGSRQPLIKRADLSAQGMGVVYRAVVGPFASQEAASQMCGNLKNAGGQCVVQRN
jgi:hypothetical protein